MKIMKYINLDISLTLRPSFKAIFWNGVETRSRIEAMRIAPVERTAPLPNPNRIFPSCISDFTSINERAFHRTIIIIAKDIFKGKPPAFWLEVFSTDLRMSTLEFEFKNPVFSISSISFVGFLKV